VPEVSKSDVDKILAETTDNDQRAERMVELSGRTCGHCAACCTWLGIKELQKFQGQTCQHLKNGDPNKRCGTYNDRPLACSSYLCVWRIGVLPDDYRPDLCGFIISPGELEGGIPCFVIHVFDRSKAGQLLPGSKLYEVLQRILQKGDTTDIRIHDIKRKELLHLTPDGEIWEAKVLPNSRDDFHGLKFVHTQNIGRYETKQIS